jgi:hypothetical protein
MARITESTADAIETVCIGLAVIAFSVWLASRIGAAPVFVALPSSTISTITTGR